MSARKPPPQPVLPAVDHALARAVVWLQAAENETDRDLMDRQVSVANAWLALAAELRVHSEAT